MNTNAIAKHYDKLTPAERFPLILAAGARDDEAEGNRLLNSCGRITLTMPDHAPLAHAFMELAALTFVELLEEAAQYLEMLQWADNWNSPANRIPAAGGKGNPKGRPEKTGNQLGFVRGCVPKKGRCRTGILIP